MDAGQAGVSYESAGATATITLLRPALTTSAKEALLDALTRASADEATRAVVLTGTGRVFCAGQDLGEHVEALRAPETAFTTVRTHYNPIGAALAAAPKPVIAAINGTCAGAGISLALACDVRVASAGARFATAFTAIGLGFDSGLSATLARAVGSARASELMLLGEPFTAEQALEWGMVGRVVAPDQLSGTVDSLARKLGAGPTQAYAAVKRSIAEAWAMPLPSVLEAELATQASLGVTRDHREAVEAFLQKRPPDFTGRN